MIAAGGDYSDTVTIDAGTRDGITTNETVLNGDGLVGTVTAGQPDTATVQLATDAAPRRRPDGGHGRDRRGHRHRLDPVRGGQLKLTLFYATAVLQPGQRS